MLNLSIARGTIAHQYCCPHKPHQQFTVLSTPVVVYSAKWVISPFIRRCHRPDPDSGLLRLTGITGEKIQVPVTLAISVAVPFSPGWSSEESPLEVALPLLKSLPNSARGGGGDRSITDARTHTRVHYTSIPHDQTKPATRWPTRPWPP